MFATIFKRRENIDTFNTSRAAFEHIAVVHEQQGRTVVFLCDTGGDDANEPCVPAFVREHNHVAVRALF